MSNKRPSFTSRQKIVPILSLIGAKVGFQAMRDREMSVEPGWKQDRVIDFFGDMFYQRRLLVERLEDGVENLDAISIPSVDWCADSFVSVTKDCEVGFLLDTIRGLTAQRGCRPEILEIRVRNRIYGFNDFGYWERVLTPTETAQRESLLQSYWDELMPKDEDPVLIGQRSSDRRTKEELERRKQWMK